MQRPWNLPSFPVYSLATYHSDLVNMNICTYVTAVSMKPKIMAIALYQNTKSLENMMQTDHAVLQLLSLHQYPLVRTLGKKSGIKMDKNGWLSKNQRCTIWHGYQVLKECAAYMELQKIKAIPTGDHTLFLFHVKRFNSINDALLTTEILGEKNIIRI